ncbi:type II secretion system minor pseudopilin GspH [Neptunicella marina]|uniref:Type II secretion system protein H n=1 Tax=Neptunicella marina TaxID=2125989 RepID=A0A8J6IU69_9ALTE|nr:type II secretion system minor pseudopilin GspH [Neptunicella marina]MBC3765867.1 type II secretion system minor pseudopilin GspH [Neptunicella marina]
MLRRRTAGFTLLEIMVVLLIIGISVTVVLLNVNGPERKDQLKQQAERFKALCTMASEYAILNQRQLGLRVEPNSYYFVVLDDEQKWQLIENNKLFAEHKLADDFTLELNLDDLPWQQDDNLFDQGVFDETLSVSDDETSIGDEEEKPLPPPQVWLFSSGDITPFSLTFTFDPLNNTEIPAYFKVEAPDALPLTMTEALERP